MSLDLLAQKRTTENKYVQYLYIMSVEECSMERYAGLDVKIDYDCAYLGRRVGP